MSVEEVKKKNNNSVLTILVVVLLLVCLTMGVYIFTNKNENNGGNNTNNNNNNPTNSEQSNAKDYANAKILVFDGSKSLNTKRTYGLVDGNAAGVHAIVKPSQNELDFSFVPSRVVSVYALNWASQRNDVVTNTIKFDKKITDIYFGGFGQTADDDTLFILLDDGTVEYIPLVHMFNNAQEHAVSYGKVPGATDVVKFVSAQVSGEKASGYVTTLAIRSDGSFYDMFDALKDSGNY